MTKKNIIHSQFEDSEFYLAEKLFEGPFRRRFRPTAEKQNEFYYQKLLKL